MDTLELYRMFRNEKVITPLVALPLLTGFFSRLLDGEMPLKEDMDLASRLSENLALLLSDVVKKTEPSKEQFISTLWGDVAFTDPNKVNEQIKVWQKVEHLLQEKSRSVSPSRALMRSGSSPIPTPISPYVKFSELVQKFLNFLIPTRHVVAVRTSQVVEKIPSPQIITSVSDRINRIEDQKASVAAAQKRKREEEEEEEGNASKRLQTTDDPATSHKYQTYFGGFKLPDVAPSSEINQGEWGDLRRVVTFILESNGDGGREKKVVDVWEGFIDALKNNKETLALKGFQKTLGVDLMHPLLNRDLWGKDELTDPKISPTTLRSFFTLLTNDPKPFVNFMREGGVLKEPYGYLMSNIFGLIYSSRPKQPSLPKNKKFSSN